MCIKRTGACNATCPSVRVRMYVQHCRGEHCALAHSCAQRTHHRLTDCCATAPPCTPPPPPTRTHCLPDRDGWCKLEADEKDGVLVHSLSAQERSALQAAPATNASHGAAATAPKQQQQPQQFVFALDEPMWRDLCRVAEAMGGPLLPQRQLAQDGAIEAQAAPTAARPQQRRRR